MKFITLNAIIVIGLIPIVLFLGNSTQVSAYLSDSIGVQLSKTCLLSENCPTYEEILFLFPDTSDQRVSGQFVFDGYLKRAESPVQNEYAFYNQKGSWFFVDPSADVASRIKLIVIEAELKEYPIKAQVINSSSIDVGTIRSVDKGCHRATLSAENWQLTLGDTMMYMKYDCDPKFTNIDTVKKKTWERTIHDIVTSYKWQLEQWYKAAIEKCGQKVCFYE